MKTAFVDELFASIQGEGLFVGARHIFVRFLGCDIRCEYCDTPAALKTADATCSCNVQESIDSFSFESVPNPVAGNELAKFCERLAIPGSSHQTISLTGGEPLLQREFLADWLPTVKQKFTIYLETNGIHADAMESIRDQVDVVSMDFKLPSATGLRSFWSEHKAFLHAAKGKQLFVKAIVTKTTLPEDIVTSARLIAENVKTAPLILQPATGPLAPEGQQLMQFQNSALQILQDVRVIPQTHKMLAVR